MKWQDSNSVCMKHYPCSPPSVILQTLSFPSPDHSLTPSPLSPRLQRSLCGRLDAWDLQVHLVPTPIPCTNSSHSQDTPKGTPHTPILAMCALSELDESHLPSHFTTLVLNLPSRVREQHWLLASSLKTARMPPVRILGAGG